MDKDRLEKVKKILDEVCDACMIVKAGGDTTIDADKVAEAICQLFEPKPKYHIESDQPGESHLVETQPKPDESRLLTDEEIVARWGAHPTTGDIEFYKRIAAAQDARTASIKDVECQQRVKANLTLLVAEIQDCKNLEAVNQLLDCWIKANDLKPEEVETYDPIDELRQALKKQEGVE